MVMHVLEACSLFLLLFHFILGVYTTNSRAVYRYVQCCALDNWKLHIAVIVRCQVLTEVLPLVSDYSRDPRI
jgi:hypothetical protein